MQYLAGELSRRVLFYYSGLDTYKESVNVVLNVGLCLSIVKRHGSVIRMMPISFILDNINFDLLLVQ